MPPTGTPQLVEPGRLRRRERGQTPVGELAERGCRLVRLVDHADPVAVYELGAVQEIGDRQRVLHWITLPPRTLAGESARFAWQATAVSVYNQMVMNATALDETFAALADPTRRAILARLAIGEASVGELAAPFAMSQPAVSKHLRVLERAGLISRGRDAQRRPCRLEAPALRVATDWLEALRRHWEESYQRLDALLEEMKADEAGDRRRGGRP